jgi:4-carboxymuconolactone decarboxylase
MSRMAISRRRRPGRMRKASKGPSAGDGQGASGIEDHSLEAVLEQVTQVYKAVPHLRKLRQKVLLGDVWKGPELSPGERSLVTCAMLAGLSRNDELRVHVKRAVANGITAQQLRGLVVHVAFYAGWPAGLAVGRAALPYLD